MKRSFVSCNYYNTEELLNKLAEIIKKVLNLRRIYVNLSAAGRRRSLTALFGTPPPEFRQPMQAGWGRTP
jgi:hypothetical protein